MGTAILWVAVVVASATILSGIGYVEQLLPILVGAAFVNLLVVERTE